MAALIRLGWFIGRSPVCDTTMRYLCLEAESVDSPPIVFHRPRHDLQLWAARTMGPPDAAWRQLISALHASGRKAALAITGGGSGAIGDLLRVQGGSRVLIEAQVPYDALALA